MLYLINCVIFVVFIFYYRCIYCITEEIFKLYETKLFLFDESDDKTVDEENICFQKARRGIHADSDLETIMKFIVTTSRRYKGNFGGVIFVCLFLKNFNVIFLQKFSLKNIYCHKRRKLFIIS